MKVHLPYGRQGLEVELPEQAQVLLPKRVPALARPQEAVRQALRQQERKGVENEESDRP
jgi:hypothetical protein